MGDKGLRSGISGKRLGQTGSDSQQAKPSENDAVTEIDKSLLSDLQGTNAMKISSQLGLFFKELAPVEIEENGSNLLWKAPDSWAVSYLDKDMVRKSISSKLLERGYEVNSSNRSNTTYVSPTEICVVRDDVTLDPNTVTELPGELQCSLSETNPWSIRIHIRVEATVTDLVVLSCPLSITVKEICSRLGKQLNIDPAGYRLYAQYRNVERMLGPTDQPILLQKRWLEEIGYLDTDDLETIAGLDNSYLFQFVLMDQPSEFSFPEEKERVTISEEMALLAGQGLYMIPVVLFKYGSTLKLLDISKNPMLKLPIDFVQMCPCLETIICSTNELDRVPVAIKEAVKLRILDLSINLLRTDELEILADLERLEVLNLEGNQLTGLPLVLSRLKHLKTLNLASNMLTMIPNVVYGYETLETLNVAFNFIKSIPDTVARLENLRELYLTCNLLTSINENIGNLNDLKILDIRGNLIQNLESLSGLARLEKLVADFNNISCIPDLQLESIRELLVFKNALSKVELGHDYRNLAFLTLCSGNLVTLPKDLFFHCPNIRDLCLDNNQIKEISPSIVQLEATLERFSMANNKINTFPDEIGRLRRLVYLDLRGNNLQQMPLGMWKCSRLKVLNVSTNFLDTFPKPPESLEPLDLEELYLAENRLGDEFLELLVHFHHLKVLNLSYNEIYDLGNVLEHLRALRELYLSGNQLALLPDHINKLKHLQIVFLNGNRLGSLPSCLNENTKLAMLDVADNSLKYNVINWEYDWNNNKELQYLNVSGNKKLEISNLSYGIRKDKRLAFFNGLDKLRVLDLSGIQLSCLDMVSREKRSYPRRIRFIKETGEMGWHKTISTAESLDRKTLGFWIWDTFVPNFMNVENEALICLFDGKGSDIVSRFLYDRFPLAYSEGLAKIYPRHPEDNSDIDDVHGEQLRKTFLSLNQELGGLGFAAELGSSAIVVHVMSRKVVIANVGDGLGVICRGGYGLVVSSKHQPFSRLERTRIRRVGGIVSMEGLADNELSLSRAFGYFRYMPTINCDPSVHIVDLTESDEFIIVSTMELWKQIDPQMAVDITRPAMSNICMATKKLRDMALAYGASGPISLTIFDLRTLSKDSTKASRSDRKRKSRDEVFDSTLARLGPEIDPPVGEVALVFTDIRNSTVLWETMPTSMEAGIKVHNGTMRRLLRMVGGYEVKTEGDAFLAAFPTVLQALKWCLYGQVQLLNSDWPQELLESNEGKPVYGSGPEGLDEENNRVLLYRGLSMRMGIHWGSPICEVDPITQRMDYLGSIVNKAARISSQAFGGQILASSEIQKMFSKFTDMEKLSILDPVFFPLGQIRLRGLEAPEYLYAVYPRSISGRYFYRFLEKSGPRKVVTKIDLDKLYSIIVRLETLAVMSGCRNWISKKELPSSNFKANDHSGSNFYDEFSPKDLAQLTDYSGDHHLMDMLRKLVKRLETVGSVLVLTHMGRLTRMMERLTDAVHTKDYTKVSELLSEYVDAALQLKNFETPKPYDQVPARKPNQ